MRQLWPLLLIGALFLMSSACAGPAEPPSVARISVLSSGAVLLDGEPSDLDRVDAALRQLKVAGGTAWYYRENAASEPPPAALLVMDLLVKNQVPVSMSTKPDFSDYVDENGWAHAREP
jgi:hypothetical protein